MQTLLRITKLGWTNFKRNSYLSFAATGVMSLVLFLFLGLLSVQFLSSQTVASLQDKLDVSVYFKKGSPEDQILAIKNDLAKQDYVKSIEYTSADQALADFREKHKNDQTIQESLDQLEENPIPASLNIKTIDSQSYDQAARFLQNHKFKDAIEDIQDNKEIISKVESLTGTIRNSGLIVIVIVVIIALLVIFNTVSLTIFNQKQEIEIMRLVGASNWQIRGPYLAEGGFYGLIATAISLVVFYPLLYFSSSSSNIGVFLNSSDIWSYFVGNIIQIVLILAVLGILLGVVSSSIAIRRHLKI